MPWPAPAHISGRLVEVYHGTNEESSWQGELSVDVRLDIDPSRSGGEQIWYKDAGSTWTFSGLVDSTAENKVCHSEGSSSGSFPDEFNHIPTASLETSLTGWGLLFQVDVDFVAGTGTCDNGSSGPAIWNERMGCQAEWVDAVTFKADGYCTVDIFVTTGTLIGS